jgi:hypothetical protein
MQFAVCLAATLLAVTSIAPVAQAARVLQDFTLIDGIEQHKVADVAKARRAADHQVAKGVDITKLLVDDEFADLPLSTPAEISTAIIDQAREHELRAIAHIFYLDNAERGAQPTGPVGALAFRLLT